MVLACDRVNPNCHDANVSGRLVIFNLGIELGQLTVVLIALMMIRLYLRFLSTLPPWLINVPVYLTGGLAA